MKKKSKLILTASFLIILIFIGLFFFRIFPISNYFGNKDKMIELTLKWGRLAPFPKNIENFTIFTEGSPFTRSFRTKFNASESIIKSWIEKSPGLNDATREILSDGKEKYIINPGDGASYAEVIIDYTAKYVEVYVSWS